MRTRNLREDDRVASPRSHSPRGSWRDGAAANWRNFTNQILAASRHVPSPRSGRSDRSDRSSRRSRRDVNREWRDAEQSQQWNALGDESSLYPSPRSPRSTRRIQDREWGDTAESRQWNALGDSSQMSSQYSAPFYDTGVSWSVQVPSASANQSPFKRWLTWRLPYWAVAMLAVVSLLMGFIGTRGVLGLLDAQAAARDAKLQITAIEATMKGGNYLSTDSLLEVQGRLRAVDSDLQRIQAGIPLSGVVQAAPGTGGIFHLLNMSNDLVHAGEAGVDAALILVPSLKGVLSSVGSGDGTTPTASAKPTTPPLTLAQIQQAQDDINTATSLAQAGIAERSQIHDSDLAAVGLSSIIPTFHKLDSLTPKLPEYLGYAHTLMAQLPTLLGITKPMNFLLLNLDSDELRPTGGFQGNYAIVTLKGGKLDGGIHLHDIKQLDGTGCYNDDPDSCPEQYPPAKFAFVATDAAHFGIRDANVDPDYPSTAKLITQMAVDGNKLPDGVDLGGVISITPNLIDNILQVTGPITVDGFGVQVTAGNLREYIHYYHVLVAYCSDVRHAWEAQCKDASASGATGAEAAQQAGTSDRKVFDAVLGQALMHKVGSLSNAEQSKVFKVMLEALTKTHDIQVYFNDPQLENILTGLKMDAAVQTPAGDAMFVVDANVGAFYVNGDVQENIQDAVTFDAQGTATHKTTITYTLPAINDLDKQHLWARLYEQSGGQWEYDDAARLIVPKTSNITDYECPSTNIPNLEQANRTVVGCEFYLGQGSYDSPSSLSLTFTWTTPNVLTNAGGVLQYTYYIQRQVSSHSTVNITITPPSGAKVVQPLTAPLVSVSGGVQYKGALTQDQNLVVSFQK